jgi:undecaprenyl-phosphate 4-deoxy-4-formamido-L-arabinose transferase
MTSASLSVVVPVYNSEGSLAELVERLRAVCAARREPFEIILVNDGSRDGSWQVVGGLAGRYPEVRPVDLSRNYGQHNALLCGIRAARYAVIATLDDDLQNPPEEIPRLLARLDDGVDVVYGRPAREQHGWWRDGASVLTKLALRHAMGAATAPHVSAFRVFRTRLRDAFADYSSPFVSVDVLLTWGTTRFAALPVRHEPRRQGRSNYNLRKLLAHALNLLTGFSTAPLQLASLLGFGVLLFGLAVLALTLLRYAWQGGSVPGFMFLTSILTIFSGTQLFALGIIGEYLGRMYLRTMARPAYVVRRGPEPAARAGRAA